MGNADRMAKIERTGSLEDGEARRLRASGRRLGRGIYAVGTDRNDLERLATRARAALLVAPLGSLVCGATALALAKLRLPHQVGAIAAGPVHLAIPRESGWHSRRPEIVGVRPRVMPPSAPTGPMGIPVACLPHCWMQVTAALLRGPGWDFTRKNLVPTSPGMFTEPRKAAFLQAVQIGDQLVRRKNPLVEFDDFASYVASAARVRGVGIARSVFGWVRARTDSTMESWLRLIVWDAGFPDPVVNHPVTVVGKPRFLDLAWPEW
jgi:hypothetical protein